MLSHEDKERRTSNKDQMKKIENKYQDGKFKPNHVDIKLNVHCSIQCEYKAEIVRLVKKVRLNYMLFIRDPLQ